MIRSQTALIISAENVGMKPKHVTCVIILSDLGVLVQAELMNGKHDKCQSPRFSWSSTAELDKTNGLHVAER